MILILVEHHLNKLGKEYFEEWTNEVRIILQKFEGFQSLNMIEDIENTNRDILLLKFENIELLRIWSKSHEHNQMIEQLTKFMTKKQKSQVLKLK